MTHEEAAAYWHRKFLRQEEAAQQAAEEAELYCERLLAEVRSGKSKEQRTAQSSSGSNQRANDPTGFEIFSREMLKMQQMIVNALTGPSSSAQQPNQTEGVNRPELRRQQTTAQGNIQDPVVQPTGHSFQGPGPSAQINGAQTSAGNHVQQPSGRNFYRRGPSAQMTAAQMASINYVNQPTGQNFSRPDPAVQLNGAQTSAQSYVN